MTDGWQDGFGDAYKKVFPPEEWERLLVEARDAKVTGKEYHDVTCRECGVRQRVQGEVRNWTAIDNILRFAHDRAIGTPNKAPEPKPDVADDVAFEVEDLSALSADELARLAR